MEEYVGHVWCALTVDENYLMYRKSQVVVDHCSQYRDEFVVPGRSFFHKHWCPFVPNPSIYSGKAWAQLLSDCADDFIASTWCPPVLHPQLACGVSTIHRMPSFVKLICINGLCDDFGIEKKRDICSCELSTLFSQRCWSILNLVAKCMLAIRNGRIT